MKTIFAIPDGPDYPVCPLRSDVNSCRATPGSKINACPRLNDDGDFWHLPEWCPLKSGGVHVRFAGDDDGK